MLALAQRHNSTSSVCCNQALPQGLVFEKERAAWGEPKTFQRGSGSGDAPTGGSASGQIWICSPKSGGCVVETVEPSSFAYTMPPSTVRVLVVDDYKPFRRFVRSTLRKRAALQIIGEASDGPEAVRLAEKLKPDLILLDIGLPSLNGIEAARQIRGVAPESKIIFSTQETSADVVQEALGVGAWGYVVKATADRDLLAAVDAVLLGQHFVSSTSAT